MSCDRMSIQFTKADMTYHSLALSLFLQEIYQTVALEKRISLLKLCIPALNADQTKCKCKSPLYFSFDSSCFVLYCFFFQIHSHISFYT